MDDTNIMNIDLSYFYQEEHILVIDENATEVASVASSSINTDLEKNENIIATDEYLLSERWLCNNIRIPLSVCINQYLLAEKLVNYICNSAQEKNTNFQQEYTTPVIYETYILTDLTAFMKTSCSVCNSTYTKDPYSVENNSSNCPKCQSNLTFQCIKCNEQFDRRFWAIRHWEYCNADDEKSKKVKCGLCDMEFLHIEPLRMHFINCEAKSNFVSDHCKYFSKLNSYIIKNDEQEKYSKINQGITDTQDNHKISNSLNRNFSCVYCPFETNYVNVLKYHMKVLHGIRYTSKQASRVAKSVKKSNKAVKAKNSASSIAYCPQCNKLENPQSMRIVCKKCMFYLIFKCEKCNEDFLTYDNLRQHFLKRHLFQTSYECSKCGKAFAQFVNFKLHENICVLTTGKSVSNIHINRSV